MEKKEYIALIEENGMIVERMLSRIHQYPSQSVGYSRQQLMVLVDLMTVGRSKLKEIAHRQGMPTPNLCIMFRKLESDGLVVRTVDDQDRRNTWYEITDAGAEIAKQALDILGCAIENLTSSDIKNVFDNFTNAIKKSIITGINNSLFQLFYL